MQPRDTDRTVGLSVLDRLLADADDGAGPAADPGRARTGGTPWSRSVTRLKSSLLRDLEWLLNTRRTIEPAPASHPETQRSVYHFGLPDLTSLSAGSDDVRRRLLHQVEEAIQLFEPRLSRVRVLAAEGAPGGGREVRFVVEGLLQMDPEPERVSFDTVLETSSGTFRLGGARA
jgi:type VI secretion system protein ImpF